MMGIGKDINCFSLNHVHKCTENGNGSAHMACMHKYVVDISSKKVFKQPDENGKHFLFAFFTCLYMHQSVSYVNQSMSASSDFNMCERCRRRIELNADFHMYVEWNTQDA